MLLEQYDWGGMIWPEAKRSCYQPIVNYFPINPCLEGFHSSYHSSLPKLMIFSLLMNDMYVYTVFPLPASLCFSLEAIETNKAACLVTM